MNGVKVSYKETEPRSFEVFCFPDFHICSMLVAGFWVQRGQALLIPGLTQVIFSFNIVVNASWWWITTLGFKWAKDENQNGTYELVSKPEMYGNVKMRIKEDRV